MIAEVVFVLNACKGILVYIHFPRYVLGKQLILLFCIDVFPPLLREPTVPYRTDHVHQNLALKTCVWD